VSTGLVGRAPGFENWPVETSRSQEAVHTFIEGFARAQGSFGRPVGLCLHFGEMRRYFLDLGMDFSSLVPRAQFVFVVRANQARQAAIDGSEKSSMVYDLGRVRRKREALEKDERQWLEYFAFREIRPLIVRYGDLVENYEETVLGVLKYLDVTHPRDYRPTILSEQEIEKVTSSAWTRQFLSDRKWANRQQAREWFKLGMRSMEGGAFQDACESFLEVLRFRVRDVPTWNNLAVCLYVLGEMDAARCALETAIKQVPSDGDLRVNLAKLLVEVGEAELAREHLRVAIEECGDTEARTILSAL
jgi:tetratricopeptide (TPR) repeat protein